MPEISRYTEHNPPHFHSEYSGEMNDHFCPDILKICALDNYCVKAHFSDGTTRICDLSKSCRTGSL